MSKPPINPDTSLAGIAVDPRTLERIIPGSKRPDGTLRKEIKIRPGFTPQEDVRRFRGTKQSQLDAQQLPKGHIIGWVPPSSAPASSSGKSTGAGLSKSQKKNQKRKEKRDADITQKIKDSWEDDDDATDAGNKGDKPTPSEGDPGLSNDVGTHTADQPSAESDAENLADKLEKLEVH